MDIAKGLQRRLVYVPLKIPLQKGLFVRAIFATNVAFLHLTIVWTARLALRYQGREGERYH